MAAGPRLVEERQNAIHNDLQTWGAGAGLFSTHGSAALATARGAKHPADCTPWPCGLVWSRDKFAACVTNPKKLVPGGKMKYDGLPDAKQREDLPTCIEAAGKR
jgi:hypothetical protein